MKLNPDCIRDILLTAEENTNMFFPSSFELLDKYDRQEVIYHIKQCQMSKLIIVVTYVNDGGYRIHNLTPKGHELISQIRSSSNWKKIISRLTKVGVSVKTIIECAALISSL